MSKNHLIMLAQYSSLVLQSSDYLHRFVNHFQKKWFYVSTQSSLVLINCHCYKLVQTEGIPMSSWGYASSVFLQKGWIFFL